MFIKFFCTILMIGICGINYCSDKFDGITPERPVSRLSNRKEDSKKDDQVPQTPANSPTNKK